MLYDYNKALKEKQELKNKEAEEQRSNKTKTVYTRDQSNRIIERLKIQKFGEMFKQLDSDGDGQISA